MHGTDLHKSVVHSPNFEPRLDGKTVNLLLLHYTGMDDALRACKWLCTPESKVSCHYLVDEAGGIFQMVDEGMRAWHAGVSSWCGEYDVNSVSIGIEIQNPGHSGGYPDFPTHQIDSVIALSRDIIGRYRIEARRVLAHSDVAPSRKIDPGEKFPWQTLYASGVGHWVPPVAVDDGPVLRTGDCGDPVAALQLALKGYGYGVDVTARYDKQTEMAVSAFQRHFRPQRVDGIADRSTTETLKKLAE